MESYLSVGLVDKNGLPLAKEWRIETTSDELRAALRPYRCSGGHEHGESLGSGLWRTAIYPTFLATLIAEVLLAK